MKKGILTSLLLVLTFLSGCYEEGQKETGASLVKLNELDIATFKYIGEGTIVADLKLVAEFSENDEEEDAEIFSELENVKATLVNCAHKSSSLPSTILVDEMEQTVTFQMSQTDKDCISTDMNITADETITIVYEDGESKTKERKFNILLKNKYDILEIENKHKITIRLPETPLVQDVEETIFIEVINTQTEALATDASVNRMILTSSSESVKFINPITKLKETSISLEDVYSRVTIITSAIDGQATLSVEARIEDGESKMTFNKNAEKTVQIKGSFLDTLVAMPSLVFAGIKNTQPSFTYTSSNTIGGSVKIIKSEESSEYPTTSTIKNLKASGTCGIINTTLPSILELSNTTEMYFGMTLSQNGCIMNSVTISGVLTTKTVVNGTIYERTKNISFNVVGFSEYSIYSEIKDSINQNQVYSTHVAVQNSFGVFIGDSDVDSINLESSDFNSVAFIDEITGTLVQKIEKRGESDVYFSIAGRDSNTSATITVRATIKDADSPTGVVNIRSAYTIKVN